MLLSCGFSRAQELTVESLVEDSTDMSAVEHPVVDFNEQQCGLVKVRLSVDGARFEGNVVGDVEYKANEFWVYLTEGTYRLWIKHPSFFPLEVNFRNYGIRRVLGGHTYVLTLNADALRASNPDAMRYLTMRVSPANATVYIDNVIRPTRGGVATAMVAKGQHSYRVEAQGYFPKSGTVDVGDTKQTVEVALESALVELSVSCPTADAGIYVDNVYKGKSSWTGQLLAGTYRVKAKLDGYETRDSSVAIGEAGKCAVDFPALVPIVGSLSVDFQPHGAEVLLDGKPAGMTPLRNDSLLAKSHVVKIEADGYRYECYTVWTYKGQKVTLQGSLSPIGKATPSDKVIDNLVDNMVSVGGFAISKYEVTQEEWAAVMDSLPEYLEEFPKCPVARVSWNDCQEFVRRLNAMTGKQFRLPTEAEWEFAARGGNKSKSYKYAGSDKLGDVAWCGDPNDGVKSVSFRTFAHDVGQKQPNELGLYDMMGNVAEWCQEQVVRGGSFKTTPRRMSISDRMTELPTYYSETVGFRLAMSE